jgi:hypothetical protein
LLHLFGINAASLPPPSPSPPPPPLHRRPEEFHFKVQYSTLAEYFTQVWNYSHTHGVEWEVQQRSDFVPYVTNEFTDGTGGE